MSYAIPGRRRRLKTTAKRRYLVASIGPDWAKTETSTDDIDAAQATAARYRREFGTCTILVIDQTDPATFPAAVMGTR